MLTTRIKPRFDLLKYASSPSMPKTIKPKNIKVPFIILEIQLITIQMMGFIHYSCALLKVTLRGIEPRFKA